MAVVLVTSFQLILRYFIYSNFEREPCDRIRLVLKQFLTLAICNERMKNLIFPTSAANVVNY